MRSILCTCVVLAAAYPAVAVASVPAQTPAPPGDATARGPSGCPSSEQVYVTVTGTSIADVTFYFDGKRVKFLPVPNQPGGRWALPIRINRIAFGTHRVQVRIEFLMATGTPPRTLRLSFNRCHPAVVPPRLTG
jgi:hypothetical protein